MSRTLKDKPYDHRPKHPKNKHPRLLRDRYPSCPYGPKCCGSTAEVYTARAVEKNSWKQTVKEAY